MLQRNSRSLVLEHLLLLKGGQSFVPFKPSTDWKRLIHTREGTQLYAKPTDLDVNRIQKHPHRSIQNNVGQISGHCGSAKLTHKINHHISLLKELKWLMALRCLVKGYLEARGHSVWWAVESKGRDLGRGPGLIEFKDKIYMQHRDSVLGEN